MMEIQLTDEQLFLIMDIEHWYYHNDSKQVYEITGKSGCGKSSTIRYAIRKLGLSNDEVVYICFSGKAANRLALEGLPAKTIHSTIYDCVKEVVTDDIGRVIRYSNGKYKTENKFVRKEKLPGIKLIVIDEGSMVGEKLAKDILSFGIPVIVLGDLNQLPPVMDKSYFLKNPDFALTKIMRQKEGDPIVYLANRVLDGEPLNYGIYGKSAVIRKCDLTLDTFRNVDIVITTTNSLKDRINLLYREDIKHITNLEKPRRGEKIICTRNNWNQSINGLYLTNGTSGIVSDVSNHVYESYYNEKFMIQLSMIPDFAPKSEFRDLLVDKYDLNRINPETLDDDVKRQYYYKEKSLDKFDYGYAVTCYKCQGDQYQRVLFIDKDAPNKKKVEYTAITRAREQIIIVK